MRLYRLMSEKEFNSISPDRPFAWKSKFKWFSPNKDFILNRVKDGKLTTVTLIIEDIHI